jgi:hypothetical protein
MKKYVSEFFKRGLVAMGGGPIILAIIYIFIGVGGEAQNLDIYDAALAILSISLLAFIAGGITMVYQIDRLPLFYAVLLHGTVLYIDYAAIYLLNGWLADGALPFLIFTACFAVGYALIWAVIYLCIRKSTKKLNRYLKNNRANT